MLLVNQYNKMIAQISYIVDDKTSDALLDFLSDNGSDRYNHIVEYWESLSPHDSIYKDWYSKRLFVYSPLYDEIYVIVAIVDSHNKNNFVIKSVHSYYIYSSYIRDGIEKIINEAEG